MSLDLFEINKKNNNTSTLSSSPSSPLAHQMRPMDLENFYGHEKHLSEGSPLLEWIKKDSIPSLILWGPPGCGKTSLAQIIAKKTAHHFVNISAVMGGIKEIKEAVEKAKMIKSLHNQSTILFIDEIHRFNKTQQDALLPHVENGTLTLIGATTENPSFEINQALLSRSNVIRLEALSKEAIKKIIERALKNSKKISYSLTKEVIELISQNSQGDARFVLGHLEQIETIIQNKQSTSEKINLDDYDNICEKIQHSPVLSYDKKGEAHYDITSAFIKSIRSSSPDAGVYYLARMLEGGEDPVFISRRLVILASEDIGNADPQALQVAIAAQQAVSLIGMPEARIPLSQAVIYLSCAPKSNASYLAIDKAISEVRKSGALPPPMYLKNAPTSLMKKEGYGVGYQYAHDQKVTHPLLPKEIENKKFYTPTENGLEKHIKVKLENKK